MIYVLALNEERHIGNVLTALLTLGQDVMLVDSGSTDDTLDIALGLGVPHARADLGIGAATAKALQLAAMTQEHAVIIDGDLRAVRLKCVESLLEAAERGVCGRGAFTAPGRVSRIVAGLARTFETPLPDIPGSALMSAYASYPRAAATWVTTELHPPTGGGIDVWLAAALHYAGFKFEAFDAGPRLHTPRDPFHIRRMALDVCDALSEWSMATW